jgi:hypothetical protein
MTNKLTQMPLNIKPLPTTEQEQVKGGLLLYCEEKRRIKHGILTIKEKWKAYDDGNSYITIIEIIK